MQPVGMEVSKDAATRQMLFREKSFGSYGACGTYVNTNVGQLEQLRELDGLKLSVSFVSNQIAARRADEAY